MSSSDEVLIQDCANAARKLYEGATKPEFRSAVVDLGHSVIPGLGGFWAGKAVDVLRSFDPETAESLGRVAGSFAIRWMNKKSGGEEPDLEIAGTHERMPSVRAAKRAALDPPPQPQQQAHHQALAMQYSLQHPNPGPTQAQQPSPSQVASDQIRLTQEMLGDMGAAAADIGHTVAKLVQANPALQQQLIEMFGAETGGKLVQGCNIAANTSPEAAREAARSAAENVGALAGVPKKSKLQQVGSALAKGAGAVAHGAAWAVSGAAGVTQRLIAAVPGSSITGVADATAAVLDPLSKLGRKPSTRESAPLLRNI
jgi:hypothetical protein